MKRKLFTCLLLSGLLVTVGFGSAEKEEKTTKNNFSLVAYSTALNQRISTEKPKLRDFIGSMQEQVSQTLHIAPGKVSIKAKTTNELGTIGRGEGIAAQAIVLIEGGKSEDI